MASPPSIIYDEISEGTRTNSSESDTHVDNGVKSNERELDPEPELDPDPDPDLAFAESLQSDTFAFLVGPTKERFTLHSKAVARVSSFFDRMVNGPMKESIDRVAELPSVEVETFVKFARFCYTNEYAPVTIKSKTKEIKVQTPEYNEIVSLGWQVLNILDAEHFWCSRCQAKADLYAEDVVFPYCSLDCIQRYPLRNKYCIACRDEAQDGLGIICKSCIERALGGPPKDIISIGLVTKMKTRWQQYATIVGNKSTALSMGSRLSRTHTVSDCSQYLLGYARMYVFAEMYSISALKDATLSNLCSTLACCRVTAEDAAFVVSLVEYAYQNTCANPDSDRGEPLRQLIIQFAADHARTMSGSEPLKELLNKGGDIVVDLFETLHA